MMDRIVYRKPPIAEAVVEVRLDSQMAVRDLERAQRRLKKRYPRVEHQLSLTFTMGPEQARIDRAPDGWKLSSQDGADIVVISPRGILNSRLAPYPGWETFSDRCREVTRIAADESPATHRPNRLGVRYINRLDIPGEKIHAADWLQVGPMYPSTISSPVVGYATRLSFRLDDRILANISTETGEPKLVAHAALVLDIDVFVEKDIPKSWDDIWQLIDKMHRFNYILFEYCITDRTRKLFEPVAEGENTNKELV